LSKPCAIALTNSLRYRELKSLKDLLTDDNRYLQDELRRISGENVIGADLFFRLRVFPIVIPPLKERKEDIPALVHHFIEKKSKEMKRFNIPAPAPGTIDQLMEYHWPGNIRELENAVERSLILDRKDLLYFKDIGISQNSETKSKTVASNKLSIESLEFDKVMARHIKYVLDSCNSRVEGSKGAAKILKIHPSTLRKRMKKLKIPFGRKA
jgi:transcriptional regulator with PAS, ATPase and Fis domain